MRPLPEVQPPRCARREHFRFRNGFQMAAVWTTFRGGRVVMTAGVNALADAVQWVVFRKIQAFDAFDDENDPWGEHDFVSVEHDGQTFFAKIDYYNRDLSGHSEDATDPEKTCRVMTIMLAEEY